ncbi:MAG: UbiD family decarboxylase domain-containing protein, partial [Vulcanimicrobiaceae bacterium]
MTFDSLRAYLDRLRSKELLTAVEGADWDGEIGAITEVVAMSKAPRALLFDRIKGYGPGWRVATNLYSSPRLQALALGLPDDVSPVEAVASWREKSRAHTPRPPRVVKDGPVRDHVQTGDQVDLLKFPSPFWHEFDGGRFFGTGCVV